MYEHKVGQRPPYKTDEIFTLSTQIIDAHYNVMNEGLRMLRLSMDKRMQAWVSR